MKAIVPSTGYLRSRILLETATRLDPIQYVNWIHDNQHRLRAEFAKSGEDDVQVWARIQFMRSMGLGV